MRFPGVPLFILGDFNFPTIRWSQLCPFSEPTCVDAVTFLNTCTDFHLSQIVHLPTRVTPTTSSLLDLVLTSAPDMTSLVTHVPGLSDHDVLHFTLSIPSTRAQKRLKQIRDYNCGNYDAINIELSSFLDNFISTYNEQSVEELWNSFRTKVVDLTNKFIPLRAVYDNTNAPWYNRYLKRLSNKKAGCFVVRKIA